MKSDIVSSQHSFLSYFLWTLFFWCNCHSGEPSTVTVCSVSGGQAFGEWAFTKIGGLICYLIVETGSIVEWISNNGALKAEGKGTSSWKETLLQSQRSLLRRAIPSAGGSFNSHKSPSAGKLPFSKGGMIKPERKAIFAVQVIRQGRWNNIRDLCC